MDSCWFGEGLFSVHFLSERLPKTELYAAEAEWWPVYETLRALFQKNRKGVEKGKLGYDGKPFAWNEEKRLHLKCQRDALYFYMKAYAAGNLDAKVRG